MKLPHALAALALALAAATPASAAYDKTACNNSPSLCSKRYSQVVHLGAHDSAFVRTSDNSWSSAANQYWNATVQLDAGVRLLQNQIHLSDSQVKLCHSSCTLFDAGPLSSYLSEVAAWLATHPSEVVTLLLVNTDKIPSSRLLPLFEATTPSLANMSFPGHASPGDTWPSLRDMIDSGERVVTFLSDGDPTAYLLPEFDSIFETAYENTDAAAYNCSIDRPTALRSSTGAEALDTGLIGLLNRFLYEEISASLELYMPNDQLSSTLNSDTGTGNLLDGATKCLKDWGAKGAFVLLDFISVGNAADVVDRLNNVTDVKNRVKAPSENPEAEAQGAGGAKGGWASVKKLAKKVETGGNVKTGQWVFAAGAWAGSIKMR
ncbi:PLC-like phosphodiesterase [Geopyxis carbonaria]|nr:PLC-like phosphodiesterase [Geopyxis carbonaria]